MIKLVLPERTRTVGSDPGVPVETIASSFSTGKSRYKRCFLVANRSGSVFKILEMYELSFGSRDAVRILIPAKPSSESKDEPADEEMIILNFLANPCVLLSGPREAVRARVE